MSVSSPEFARAKTPMVRMNRSMPRFSRTGPEIQSARGPLMLKVSMTIRNWNLDSKPHLFDFGVFFNMWWTPIFALLTSTGKLGC